MEAVGLTSESRDVYLETRLRTLPSIVVSPPAEAENATLQPRSIPKTPSTDAAELSGEEDALSEGEPPRKLGGVDPPLDALEHLHVADRTGDVPTESDEELEDLLEEDEESPVENPSLDIRGDLEAALKSNLSFNGTFYYRKTDAKAPNPCLRLDGYGYVGQPLNPVDALAISSICQQAPFGKGEKTVIDKAVRDTWELDASHVHFDNPAWEPYLKSTIDQVCHALGVNVTTSRPRANLYKLLLYESGSHFLPHQDTEKEPGMFASVIVVLPSVFTGGEVHLSHAGLSATLDCSAESLLHTSTLAWYTDVKHEIKPVASGYRLALAYNLVHTTTSLQPSLPSTHEVVLKLRHILLSWKRRNDTKPLKIVYLLDHEYSQVNLRADALKGKDAHKVAVLDMLAQELGFRLALGSIESHLTGYADDHGDGPCGFAERPDRIIKMQDIVDLNGERILSSYDFEEKNSKSETIPKELYEAIENGDPDDEEYEGYMGNGAGEMEQWYRRTILLIWPNEHNVEIEFGKEEARAIIHNATTDQPTAAELEAVAYLLRAIGSDSTEQAEMIKLLMKASCRWRDFRLWRKVVRQTGAIDHVRFLDMDSVVGAFVIFGVRRVKAILEAALAKETDNTSRLAFLGSLELRFQGQAQHLYLPWIIAQRENILKTLQPPKKGEETLLMDLANQRGGLTYLYGTIVPQVLLIGESRFLFALAHRICERAGELIAKDSTQTPLVASMVTNLLTVAISRLHIYTPKKVEAPKPRAPTKPPRTPLPSIMYALESCYDLNNAGLAGSVLTRALEPASTSARYVSVVLQPLVTQIVEFCARRGLSLTSGPIADTVRSIIIAWECKVLGPKPNDWDVGAQHEDAAKKITCTCAHCAVIKRFLNSGHAREQALQGVGATTVQHLQRSLAPLRQVVTSFVISSVPRGLNARKNDGALAATAWKKVANDGLAWLKRLHSEELVAFRILDEILEDDYPRFMELLTGKRVTRTHASGHQVASQEVANAPPAPVPPSRQVHDPPATPSAPRAKRRKTDTEIIDLCTP